MKPSPSRKPAINYKSSNLTRPSPIHIPRPITPPPLLPTHSTKLTKQKSNSNSSIKHYPSPIAYYALLVLTLVILFPLLGHFYTFKSIPAYISSLITLTLLFAVHIYFKGFDWKLVLFIVSYLAFGISSFLIDQGVWKGALEWLALCSINWSIYRMVQRGV